MRQIKNETRTYYLMQHRADRIKRDKARQIAAKPVMTTPYNNSEK